MLFRVIINKNSTSLSLVQNYFTYNENIFKLYLCVNIINIIQVRYF